MQAFALTFVSETWQKKLGKSAVSCHCQLLGLSYQRSQDMLRPSLSQKSLPNALELIYLADVCTRT